MGLSTPIYFDYNATTPVDPRVLEAMLPYFTEHFGNPSSQGHQWGWSASRAVEKARSQIAELLSTKSNEWTFTSGATESNNWIIYKMAEYFLKQGPTHFITSQIEHPSVAKAFDLVEKMGVQVSRVPCTRDGLVELEAFKQAITPHTRFASIIWVQNEIGTIQPIKELSAECKERGILFHSDATQAVGKINIDLTKAHVDFLSLSAHKIYGPKGVGALFHRHTLGRELLAPLLVGGNQERGLRSTTSNVPGVVGLGKACEILNQEMNSEIERMLELRNLLFKGLQAELPQLQCNGCLVRRSPNNLSLTFKGYPVERLLPLLPQLAISQGSACHSDQGASSPILKAIGLTPKESQETFRFSLGRGTTESQVSAATDILINTLKL